MTAQSTFPALAATPPPAAPRRIGPGGPDPWRFAAAAGALSGSAIREILKATERPEILSFAGGLPNPDAFPVPAVQRASRKILRDDAVGALQYGPTEGYGPLREQIAARLSAAGQPTAVANVLVTTGSQQGLDLIGKALLNPGDALLAANPSYLGALQAFALASPRLFDLAAPWPTASLRPAFCYLTPTFANPDGATWPTSAREALLDRLATAGVPLIEDDAYGELWFDAPPPPACRALAPESTLYLGSFSKVLAPGLRVGFVAGPAPVIALLTRLKQATDLHTPGYNQRLVSALIADGTLDAHLPVLRRLYRGQRDALMTALERRLSGHATWTTPQGGMFAWLTLNGGRDTGLLFAAALREGVAFVPGAPFHFNGAGAATLRLAFSTVPAASMDAGMARLAAALDHPIASGDGDR